MPSPVDYRFLLANERTFLAYIRTALAMQVTGLGILQFLTRSGAWPREALGGALVLVGSYLAAAGYLRWRANDRTIRSGEDMSSPPAAKAVALAVAALPILGVAIVLAV
jgi:putative membrane protein